MIDRDREVDLDDVAGFLALRSPRAGELQRLLRGRGVFTDYRGDVLRLGPAPYLSDAQLEEAMGGWARWCEGWCSARPPPLHPGAQGVGVRAWVAAPPRPAPGPGSRVLGLRS